MNERQLSVCFTGIYMAVACVSALYKKENDAILPSEMTNLELFFV